MTTNAGSRVSGALGFGESLQALAESKTEQALSEFLRPEFLNRIDEIVTFRSLSREDFEGIAHIMLDELADALRQKGYKVNYDKKAAKTVAENSYSEKFGARNMRRYIQSNIEDEIAEKIIAAKTGAALISISAKDGKMKITVV